MRESFFGADQSLKDTGTTKWRWQCSHPSAYFFSLFFWVRWGVGVSVCPPVTQIWNTGRNLQQMTLKSIKYLSFLKSIYLTHFCHFFELVLFNVGFHFLFCFWSLMFKGRSTYRSSCFGFSATWFFCSFCCSSLTVLILNLI